MIEVSLNILVWNDEKYLPDLFASIRKQTYPHITVRMLDNGSTDGTLAYIREHAPEWLVAHNNKNLGFARGHNQIMTAAMHRWQGQDLTQKAIVIANSDMVFDERLIERLVEALEKNPDVDCVQPKLFRAFATKESEDEQGKMLSDIIDTTGLVGHKNWRLEDRGAGEKDMGQYDSATDLLAPAGALALYRASALADVAEGADFFDGDFGSYREDCDLGLRLRRAGHKTVFAPSAHGWHYRGMYGAAQRNLWERLKDRVKQGGWRKAMSTRNQLFVLIKNLTAADVLRAFPRILFHEGGRVGYALIAEPETRRLLLSSGSLFVRMWGKRKKILASAKESPQIIRRYMV